MSEKYWIAFEGGTRVGPEIPIAANSLTEADERIRDEAAELFPALVGPPESYPEVEPTDPEVMFTPDGDFFFRNHIKYQGPFEDEETMREHLTDRHRNNELIWA